MLKNKLLHILHTLAPGESYTPADVLAEHCPYFLRELETLKEKIDATL